MANKKKTKVNYTKSPSGVITLHINPNDLTFRNVMHFQAQLQNKGKVFKDRTKYSRKRKHKNQED